MGWGYRHELPFQAGDEISFKEISSFCLKKFFFRINIEQAWEIKMGLIAKIHFKKLGFSAHTSNLCAGEAETGEYLGLTSQPVWWETPLPTKGA